MPITVVTHRDDVGAPTNREVYAAAGSWRRGPNGLEIVSVDRRVIATYPDGNWLSVYADNRVRVHTAGRPEEEPVPRQPGAQGVARSAAEAVAAPVGARSASSDEAVLVPDEILAADDEPAAVADDWDAALPDTIDAQSVDAETIEAAPADAEAGTDDAGEPDAHEPAKGKGEKAEADTATTATPRPNLPPGMRPVAFRPRLVRPARRPEEPSRPSPMRPLVFRARTYRKPDE